MNSEKEYTQILRTSYRYIPIIVIATLTINVLGLALPLTMKQIYSRIIIYESTDTLIILLVGCAIALMLESIMRSTKDATSKWIASKYEFLLSSFLVKKVLNIQSAAHPNLGTYSNIERFKAVPSLSNYYSVGFYQILVDLPFAFLFLYLIYYLGGVLVLVPITMMALYAIVMLFNTKAYVEKRKLQLDTSEEVMEHLSQSLVKIHLIKSAGIEEHAISGFKEKSREYTEAEYNVNQTKMLPDSISGYITQINLFATFCIGGYLLLNGQLYFGEIIACALLGGRAIAPVISYMKLYMQKSDIKMQKERIDALALVEEQYDEETPEFSEDISGVVEMIKLGYFDVEENAEKSITARIRTGSFVYIDPKKFLSYGDIINQLVGKKPITKGNILIDSMDISEWNMDTLKGKIEHVSDSIPIFKGTILDNITLFNNSKNRDVYEVAALTGLDKIVTLMPEGFETTLDSQSRNYLQTSFMQRLNLTRALLYRPRILIINRIDDSLDYETLEIFLWILSKLKGGVTIIIATENERIMDMADSVLTKEGLINARG